MSDHLTFENMELNVEYECIKYRAVFAKWDYIMLLKFKKLVI